MFLDLLPKENQTNSLRSVPCECKRENRRPMSILHQRKQEASEKIIQKKTTFTETTWKYCSWNSCVYLVSQRLCGCAGPAGACLLMHRNRLLKLEVISCGLGSRETTASLALSWDLWAADRWEVASGYRRVPTSNASVYTEAHTQKVLYHSLSTARVSNPISVIQVPCRLSQLLSKQGSN